MSEVKHTPGPWTWGEDHPQNACATVYGVAEWGQYEIAQLYSAPTDVAKQDANGVWGDHPERRANARLIAAAPELLEALRGMVSGYEEYDMPDGKPVLRPLEKQSSWIQRALAAIAKAEGRA